MLNLKEIKQIIIEGIGSYYYKDKCIQIRELSEYRKRQNNPVKITTILNHIKSKNLERTLFNYDNEKFIIVAKRGMTNKERQRKFRLTKH